MNARHLFITCFAAGHLAAAYATDIATVPLPAAVADSILAYGGRAVTLPAGNWTVVSRAEGSITQGVMHVRPHTTVYAADVHENRLRAGVVLRMAESSVPVGYWKERPCEDIKGEIHKEELSPEPHFPECFAVWKWKTHLSGRGTSAFYTPAQQWMDGAGVNHKGGFYEIYYSRNAANDFGSVRVWVPVSTFASDADAIAWGKRLPGALQRVFERRDTTGALPPLPSPTKP